jgi:hypothetical protein
MANEKRVMTHKAEFIRQRLAIRAEENLGRFVFGHSARLNRGKGEQLAQFGAYPDLRRLLLSLDRVTGLTYASLSTHIECDRCPIADGACVLSLGTERIDAFA